MMTKKFFLGAVVFGMLVALVAQAGHADEGAAQPSRTDQLLVKAQRICPVTGKNLLSMGGPIKAEVGGATVFLCCKGCFGQPLHKEHWAKVQANLAAAQEVCPIFKRPLGERPVPVVVNHRLVFVCCKPCTAKVQADPARSIAFVDEQLARRFAEPRR